jgi:hypothetical protein
MRALPVRPSSLDAIINMWQSFGQFDTTTTHDDAPCDQFEWQLYSPEELADEAAKAGLELERVCTEFDEARSPTSESPRMQLVFVRAV